MNEYKITMLLPNVDLEIMTVLKQLARANRALSDASGASDAAKEVVSYRTSLWVGYEQVKAREMLITNMIVEIQALIEKNGLVSESCRALF